MKKLFEWKYIIPLIVLQSGLVYIILMAPKDLSGTGLLLAFAVIFFISRKVSKDVDGNLISKRQYASFFTYLLVTIMIGVIISVSASTVDSKRDHLSKYIDAVVNQLQKQVPIRFNDYVELVKISKVNDHTLMKDVRYFSYTRNDVLADFGNSEAAFQKEILKAELQVSCPAKELRDVLELGLVTQITYYGKDNQSITQIQIDKNSCEPYIMDNNRDNY